jgi:hypothetical protein
MKLIQIYTLIKETHEELKYLIEPVVREDIRLQLKKLEKVLSLLEEIDIEK